MRVNSPLWEPSAAPWRPLAQSVPCTRDASFGLQSAPNESGNVRHEHSPFWWFAALGQWDFQIARLGRRGRRRRIMPTRGFPLQKHAGDRRRRGRSLGLRGALTYGSRHGARSVVLVGHQDLAFDGTLALCCRGGDRCFQTNQPLKFHLRSSSKNAAASRCIDRTVCAYVSRVIEARAWPSRSWATFTLVPEDSSSDAEVCRRS